MVVRSRGGTSSGSTTFTLMRPSLGSYTPRYSPEPAVEHPGTTTRSHVAPAASISAIAPSSRAAAMPS
ncbi:MAG: hypothetical protein HC868_17645 [Sphingomonadales bacterium]|nr:hypothetical protein [Sphingomonadales bacterium]